MPFIHIKTNRLEYRFEINGKYTVIQGDSATGKTTFHDLVSAMFSEPKSAQNLSGVELVPVGTNADETILKKYVGAVLVLDEFCSLFKMHNIATLFKESDNYFIIINRDEKTLGFLPIHVDNIFSMKTSGKFHTLERRYKRYEINELQHVDTIITEDKKSGYLFLEDMLSKYNLEDNNIILEPAYGNTVDRLEDKKKAGASKIVRSMEYYIDNGRSNILIVYDASAFGAYINLLDFSITSNKSKVNIYVLDWDSFEGYILGSRIYNEHYTLKDLDFNNESLEQFMTNKLSEKLENYNKNSLHKCLRSSRCKNCKDGSGCRYRIFPYMDLIYGKVRLFYESIANQYAGNVIEAENSDGDCSCD